MQAPPPPPTPLSSNASASSRENTPVANGRLCLPSSPTAATAMTASNAIAGPGPSTLAQSQSRCRRNFCESHPDAHAEALRTAALFRDDDPQVQNEILQLIAEHFASPRTPDLPETTATLRAEMGLRSREEEELERERDLLATRLLDGDWAEAERLIGARIDVVRSPKALLYKIYRQQFLELIEASESQKAFNLLLRRIKPLEYYAQDAGEFRELSYLLSARSVAEAPRFASWGGAVDGREELVEGLRAMGGGGAFGKKIATGQAPSSASPAAAASASYVPEGRLVALLRQAVAWQVHSARYPSKILPAISLMQDYVPFVVPERLEHTFRTHSANIKCLRFLGEDGRRIVSGSSDATLSIISSDPSTALPGGPTRLVGHKSRVWALDVDPAGRTIVSASGDGTVRVWDAEHEDGRCLALLGTGRDGDVYSVSWAKNKNQVVSGGYDRILKLYDVDTKNTVKTFTGHTLPVTSTAFSPDGKLLISGSKDRCIKVWDVTSGVLVHTISSALGEISSVDVDWQGRLLLASAKDNSNTLFDLRMVKPLKRFTHLANTSRNFIRSAFAHASLVVGGSEDGLVYLWDHHRNQGGTSGEDGAATSTIVAAGGTTSEEPIATLEGHKGGSCYEVRWSGGSQMLASCGDDRTVRIWV